MFLLKITETEHWRVLNLVPESIEQRLGSWCRTAESADICCRRTEQALVYTDYEVIYKPPSGSHFGHQTFESLKQVFPQLVMWTTIWSNVGHIMFLPVFLLRAVTSPRTNLFMRNNKPSKPTSVHFINKSNRNHNRKQQTSDPYSGVHTKHIPEHTHTGCRTDFPLLLFPVWLNF